MKDNKLGQPSGHSISSNFWKKIWGIKAPPATKYFLWRAASESLATNLNLHKRKVVESPLCPICSMHPESVAHAFWTCSAAQDVWSMSSRRIQKLSVWHKRNSWLFEKHFHPPIQVSKQVLAELNAIGTWLENSEKRIKVQVPHITQWFAPPTKFFKANWDAAIDKCNSRLGIGVIIRDSDASLCVELGLHQFILEGDSLGVVKAVQQGKESWSSTGMVIRDIKVLLSKVRGWSIQHVPREINVIAHVLAKFALTCLEDCILIEDYPSCIQHLL
ncbi:hypothetical protein F2P56_004057 [Juglans regia]|uniref:Uncharacterized protein LOC108995748 n=2 Tax=Juglans regia TaxID=51240 RepID=A0A2I4F5J9_JUGRE|nr:uncharacterized protein LOC108995748 [Juglans regia]KAF5477417.1 hypothetical protein F2P56_004057 [Juglans regia]